MHFLLLFAFTILISSFGLLKVFRIFYIQTRYKSLKVIAMSSQSKAYVKIRTKPIAKLFGYYVKFPLYVHGHHFKISISITNMGATTFNGGRIEVRVLYAFVRFPEIMSAPVSPIDAGDTVEVNLKGKWGVLAHGHALLLAELYDIQNNSFPLCDEKSELLAKQDNGYHIHSFYSISRGELYTLTALYVSVLSAILLNYDKLVELFRKVLEFITQIIN